MFADHLPRHYTMDEIDLPHDVDLTPTNASAPTTSTPAGAHSSTQLADAPSFVSLQAPSTTSKTTAISPSYGALEDSKTP
jgi:hypothetical protein